MGLNADYALSTVSRRAPVRRLIEARHAEQSWSMDRFRPGWLDHELADGVARHHLDSVGRELGRGVVLVRSDQKTGDDGKFAQVPLAHPRRRRFVLAIDRQVARGKAALAVQQRWPLRAGMSRPCGDLVHMVGENSSRTILVEYDHAQGGPSGHRHR